MLHVRSIELSLNCNKPRHQEIIYVLIVDHRSALRSEETENHKDTFVVHQEQPEMEKDDGKCLSGNKNLKN